MQWLPKDIDPTPATPIAMPTAAAAAAAIIQLNVSIENVLLELAIVNCGKLY